jgi:methyltransferase (TIGR00027 family)
MLRCAAEVPPSFSVDDGEVLVAHSSSSPALAQPSTQLTRKVLERSAPGAFGYFNARTCYFDDVSLREATAGLDQLVLLGAGFDSRPIRFAEQLAGTRVFEVDMPQVLRTRAERLVGVAALPPTVAVPIDFQHDDLAAALAAKGYRASARTLFLWEGVTYYLPPSAVEGVLASIASQTREGSSLFP